MRTLWILFSALVAGAAVAVYVISPIDPLQWVAELIFGAGTLRLPAAGPVTRVADAALAGAIVVYLLAFIPLSAATWLDGGRQLRAFRRAQAATNDGAGDRTAGAADTSSSWWPLLAPFGRYGGRGADMDDARSVSKTGRAALIDNLVANQSAAAVFRDFPVIAIGLGLIALIGQLLPVLAADPGVIVGGSNAALGNAMARGFCSLIAAVAAAALFGLLSQLVGAILRKRAESICGAAALAIRQRRWTVVEAERRPVQPSLLVTPLPQGDIPRRLDVEDKLIEHGGARSTAISAEAGRAFAESVEKAIRDIQVNTLRPMLHDISRLMSLLGDRAGSLVENVDDRLTQQTDQSRQILAASQETSRMLAMLGEGTGRLADNVDERLKQQAEQSRQMLAASQEISRALTVLAEGTGRLAADADDRSKWQTEQSQQILAASQESSRLLSMLGERAGHLAESVDDRLKQQTEQSRQILAASQEVSRLLAVLADRPVASAAAQDSGGVLAGAEAAALQELRQSLTEGLAGAIGQAAERIDGSAAAVSRIGMLLESASGTIEQKLDRLVAAQEARPPAAATAANGQLPAEAAEEIAAVARAAREALDAVAALSQQLRSEAPRPVAYSAMIDSDPQSWAQRVSALHRLSISSTSGLPALDSAGLALIGTGLEDAPEHSADELPSRDGPTEEPKPAG